MTPSKQVSPGTDRRRWWRHPATFHVLAGLYVVLGAWWIVDAARGGRQGGWVFGPMLALAGLLLLTRGRPTLADGVLQVPARAFGRRRVPVAEVVRFAQPHPLDTALLPSAVLRSGERVLLRDVDETLLRTWSAASGVPIVRDPKPGAAPTGPSTTDRP